jgi:hypothetical protein
MHASSRQDPGRRRHVRARGPWLCRLRLFVITCARALAASTGMVLPDLSYLLEGQPVGPPPGHPECLVPDLPPTETERVLWAQLTPVNPRL